MKKITCSVAMLLTVGAASIAYAEDAAVPTIKPRTDVVMIQTNPAKGATQRTIAPFKLASVTCPKNTQLYRSHINAGGSGALAPTIPVSSNPAYFVCAGQSGVQGAPSFQYNAYQLGMKLVCKGPDNGLGFLNKAVFVQKNPMTVTTTKRKPLRVSEDLVPGSGNFNRMVALICKKTA